MATASLSTSWTPTTPALKTKERRSEHRYPLCLPLTVRRVSDCPIADRPLPLRLDGAPSGRTHDVSAEGIYFTVDQKFTVGQELAFTLTLPANLTSGTEVFICGRGKVVRTEKKMEAGVERTGVAAIIERHEIVREDPRYAEAFVA